MLTVHEVIKALENAVASYMDDSFPIVDDDACDGDEEIMAYVREANPRVLSATLRLLNSYRSVMWEVQDELEHGGQARECDQVLSKQMRQVLRTGEPD